MQLRLDLLEHLTDEEILEEMPARHGSHLRRVRLLVMQDGFPPAAGLSL
jgi:hypothetical protein